MMPVCMLIWLQIYAEPSSGEDECEADGEDDVGAGELAGVQEEGEVEVRAS